MWLVSNNSYSTFQDAIGTCVLFEEGPQNGTFPCILIVVVYFLFFYLESFMTALFHWKTENGPTLKYKCHTPRKLMMQRIFLTEKKEEASTSGQYKSSQQHLKCLDMNKEQLALLYFNFVSCNLKKKKYILIFNFLVFMCLY